MKVILGVIVNTFGVKGEVKVHSNTSFAKKRYKKGNVVTLYNPNTKKEMEVTINSYKVGKGVDIISFLGYETQDSILGLIGCQVLIEKPENDLAKGSFYYADLLGCSVYHEEKLIGIVDDIFDSGSQQVLKIKKENGKILNYPFLENFIKEVDVDNKVIKLNPIEGLLDL